MSSRNTLQQTLKDLPIYKSLDANQAVWVSVDQQSPSSELEKAVSQLRQAGCQFLQTYKKQKDATIEFYQSTKSTLDKNLEHIRSETNIIPKVAFISLSGFSGLLIGFRRSALRKFFYATVLTTGAAAVCYPNEAKLYTNKTIDLGKQYYKDYVWPSNNKPTNNNNNNTPKATTQQQVDSKDKIVKLDSKSLESSNSNITGSMGQSNEQDKDMYTTRSK